jgi:hypothetical protein
MTSALMVQAGRSQAGSFPCPFQRGRSAAAQCDPGAARAGIGSRHACRQAS